MQRVKQEVTKYNQHSERRWSMRCVCCQVKLPFLTHTHRHQSESRTPVSLSAIVRHPIVIISYSGADYVLRSVYSVHFMCIQNARGGLKMMCVRMPNIFVLFFSSLIHNTWCFVRLNVARRMYTENRFDCSDVGA